MALPTTLARYRSAVIYIHNESPSGSMVDLATLDGTTDSFLLTTPPAITQAGNYTDTNEIGSDLISGGRILNYFEYATFDMEFYAKPGATVAVAPDEHTLLANFFGATVSTSTTHTYSFANKMQTMTLANLQATEESRQLFVVTGCVPTSLSVALAKDGPVTWTMGITGNHVYYGGVGEIDSKTAGSGTDEYIISLAGPKRSEADQKPFASDIVFDGETVEIVTSAGVSRGSADLPVSDSGVGENFTITDDSEANTVGTNIVAGDLVIPALPEPTRSTNEGVGQQNVQVFLANQNSPNASDANTDLFNSANALNVTTISLDFDRGVTQPALTEMSGSAFPPAIYVINQPAVTGSFSALLLPKHFRLPKAIADSPNWALGVQITAPDGSSVITFYMPAVHLEVPTIAEADGVSQLDISFALIAGDKATDTDKFKLIYS
jgi:hypothetical protein